MQTFNNEKLIEVINKCSEAIIEFGKKLTKALKPLFKTIHEICQKIWDGLWVAYREAGMPYGETDDGLLLWWKDVCQSYRLKTTIERDLTWRHTLQNFRRNINYA